MVILPHRRKAFRTPVEPVISGLVLSLTGDSRGLGAVDAWNDASGNGFHCIQGVGVSQPNAVVGPNGRRVLQFDGTNDFLTGASLTVGNDDFSVVVVASVTAGTASGARFIGVASNSDDRDYIDVNGFVMSVLSPSTFFIYRNNATRATMPMTLSQWGVFTAEWSGSQNQARINDGSAATASDSGVLNCQKYRIGAAFNLGNPAGTYLNGFIGSIRVFNRKISDLERGNLVAYFRAYYAI